MQRIVQLLCHSFRTDIYLPGISYALVNTDKKLSHLDICERHC
jgi:hypothetical protein